MKGRSVEELGVDSQKLMTYIKRPLKIPIETEMKKKCSITDELKRALLTYFVQDHSQKNLTITRVLHSDFEPLPPFLIILPVFGDLTEEMISCIP